jgi:hypothetical protein
MEDAADEATRRAVANDPVAVAALQYADLVHKTQICRHFDEHRAARAEAARALIQAVRDTERSESSE